MNQNTLTGLNKVDSLLSRFIKTETFTKSDEINFTLSPGYISGLTQSDGSFFCSLLKSSKHRFGIQFRPRFTITADLDSKYILDSIKTYFNCGNVTINEKNYTAEFLVDKIGDLYNIIIPHFFNYPVYCGKLHAFNLFTKIVTALFNKNNRSIEGRRELLYLAISMNVASNRKEDRVDALLSLLGVTELKDKELLMFPYINEGDIKHISNDHIAGIIDGDGSFFISFQTDGTIKTGFNITSDKNSKYLLEKIQLQLENIGSIHEGSKNELVYTVNGINQIIDVLIPFMDNNPIFSEKAMHYSKFRTVSHMLGKKKEQPLTLQSKLNIVELAYDMNKKGKRRLMSKLEYINLLKQLHSCESGE